MKQTLLSFIVINTLMFIFSTVSWAETKIVGYIPAYKGLKQSIDNAQLNKLTHINISFLNPDMNGVLIHGNVMACMANDTKENITGSELLYAVNKIHQAGAKVLISLAGGVLPHCSGNWSKLLNPEHRDSLINNLLRFVDKFNLDGLDIDIEGELLTKIDNSGNYLPFIKALSFELKKRNKLLTVATASYEGGSVPVSSLPYFDFVNIMSYDQVGPTWGQVGKEHASYQHALNEIILWKKLGLSKNKLVLGVPFYGYGFGRYKGEYSFNELLNRFGNKVINNDVIGELCADCDYVTFNSINTITAKTKLALQQGTGVMIWELTHDTKGQHSLLNAIHSQVQAFKK
ncbi:MAG: glycosyl hydrolase family 18 [Colwellia sp.]|nr:glycosyl hydrolase family 18 [Colwellia sp.]